MLSFKKTREYKNKNQPSTMLVKHNIEVKADTSTIPKYQYQHVRTQSSNECEHARQMIILYCQSEIYSHLAYGIDETVL